VTASHGNSAPPAIEHARRRSASCGATAAAHAAMGQELPSEDFPAHTHSRAMGRGTRDDLKSTRPVAARPKMGQVEARYILKDGRVRTRKSTPAQRLHHPHLHEHYSHTVTQLCLQMSTTPVSACSGCKRWRAAASGYEATNRRTCDL
jgi:hypothetical protein